MKHKKVQILLQFFLKILVGALVFQRNDHSFNLNIAFAQTNGADSDAAGAPAGEKSSSDSAEPKEDVTPPSPAEAPEDSKPVQDAPEDAPSKQETLPESEPQKDALPQEEKETAPSEKTRKKKKKNAKDGAEAAAEQPNSEGQTSTDAQKPADYDAHTPGTLKNRLRVGLGGSLGIGTGASSDFSSDYLGYYVQGSYGLTKLELGQSPLNINIVGRYATHTGINKEKSQDVVVQRFLIGGGLEYKNGKAPYRLGGVVSLDLTRVVGADFSLSEAYQTSHHFNVSVEGYVAYRIYSKIALVGGLELAPLIDYSWYGLQLGTLFSF